MPPHQALEEMVERDLRPRGIRDERVLAAFRQVDRAHFVGALDRARAYADRPLPLTHGQTVSQPLMVALMLQELTLSGTEKVLEIGTGSGYQTALLAVLVREVWTVERIEYLATTAEDRLTALGYRNIRYRWGDGLQGWPEGAPFDRIVVAAACRSLPEAYTGQLAEGGVLAAPVGPPEEQILTLGRRAGTQLVLRTSTSCLFVPLLGGAEGAGPGPGAVDAGRGSAIIPGSASPARP